MYYSWMYFLNVLCRCMSCVFQPCFLSGIYFSDNWGPILPQRAKVATSTPMTPELFMQWKKKTMDEREAGLAAQRADRAKHDRMR